MIDGHPARRPEWRGLYASLTRRLGPARSGQTTRYEVPGVDLENTKHIYLSTKRLGYILKNIFQGQRI